MKGPCWFAALEHYDSVKGTAVDYMHFVLEGVTKSLLKLWFSSSLKTEPYNVSEKVQEVDESLSQIKPPNDITRCLRKVENEMQHWKDSVRFFCFMDRSFHAAFWQKNTIHTSFF